jgi:hypothetical protein
MSTEDEHRPSHHRRFLSPPQDMNRLVVLLAAICGMCLVVMTLTLTFGYVHLAQQDVAIQEQRLAGARSQCALVAQIDPDSAELIARCVGRVCEILHDLDRQCDFNGELARARQ